MADIILDVRDLLPVERHPKIHAAFDSFGAGGSLTILDDRDPRPLFYEVQVEIDAFDADNYAVEQRASDESVVTPPKQ